MLTFVVYGDAAPKGSARAFVPKGWTRPVITSATKGLKDWERKIAAAAGAVVDGTLIDGPVRLDVIFVLSRPKALGKKQAPHVKRPDLDKLIRGATDALTGVVWQDDSQIVSITASKHYVTEASQAPRAIFVINDDDVVGMGGVWNGIQETGKGEDQHEARPGAEVITVSRVRQKAERGQSAEK